MVYGGRWCATWLIGVVVCAGALRAQLTPIPTDQLDSAFRRHSPAPIGGPGEMYWDVRIDDGIRTAMVPNGSPIPRAEIDARTHARAQAWLDSLRGRPVKGWDVLAYAKLAMTAGDVTLAEAQFSTWVATPGFTVDERAGALFAAVRAFADLDFPERLPIAKHYLPQLTALGPQAMDQDFGARYLVVQEEYALKRWADVVVDARPMYADVGRLPELERAEYGRGNGRFNLLVAQAMLALPAGRRAVDSLIASLFAANHPSEAALAAEPDLAGLSADWAHVVREDSLFLSLVGRPAPPIIGNLWFHTSDTTMHADSLHDGAVHVLAFCTGECADEDLRALERIQAHFGKGVRVMGIPTTMGHWGAQFVEPREESRLARVHYDSLQLSVPIAFWLAEKTRQPDGGMLAPLSPNYEAYRVNTPTVLGGVVVVDRRGIVRRYFRGDDAILERGVETLVTGAVDDLLAEHHEGDSSEGGR